MMHNDAAIRIDAYPELCNLSLARRQRRPFDCAKCVANFNRMHDHMLQLASTRVCAHSMCMGHMFTLVSYASCGTLRQAVIHAFETTLPVRKSCSHGRL